MMSPAAKQTFQLRQTAHLQSLLHSESHRKGGVAIWYENIQRNETVHLITLSLCQVVRTGAKSLETCPSAYLLLAGEKKEKTGSSLRLSWARVKLFQ